MEDIIDIIVTETTNTIEITSQSTDEVIDVNIIDNREDITLNVTPTVVEININSLTGNFGVAWGEITGTLSAQTDLNTALGLKADLVGGKVPSSQLPSYVDDVVEVANYAALPATGETGKIYVILDTNKIYRWSGSVYVEIADSTAVWGAITGTLSSQTDLQSALNAKFDDPTGDTTQYIAGDGSLITFPVAGQSGTLVREVRNTTGATLTKGTIVYISGATGNKPTVSKALATGDSTSAQTFGMCQADIANNSNGYVVCVGDITGLDTSALTEGAQLYLSSTTAGTYTTTKQLAPAHLVYIGIVTRAHPTLGQIEVKIQNGYELDEIHDVAISSVANNQGIFWESSTSLWKNKSIATVLGYTPANGADYLPLTGGTLTGTLIGTRAEFTTSTLVDGVLVNNGSGRGIRIVNAGAGYGLIINNETASSAIPFLIQKSGVDKIYFTDAGAGNFTSSLTASSFIKSGGTSAQFLKANGSVDSNTYLPTTGGTMTGALFGDSASFSGYVGFGGNTSPLAPIDVTGAAIISGQLKLGSTITNGTYTYTLPSATGTLALTSQLSSYLPLSGGTLTGALGGTSATFSGAVVASNITNNGIYYGKANASFPSTSLGYFALKTNNLDAERGGLTVQVSNSTSTFIDALTLNYTGAATFSSSVTAQAIYATDATGSAILTTNGGGEGILSVNTANPLRMLINGSERMRITSSGNVGIGTTSPTGAKLDVRDDSVNSIRWGSTSTQYGFTSWDTNLAIIGGIGASTSIGFWTNGNTERMRITSAGHIQTNGNPVYAFNGSISIGGSYQTIFAAVSGGVYLVSVTTDSADGTFGLLTVINDPDKSLGMIYGNNISLQFSGDNVQMKSTNGSTYNTTWTATRLK
jgi:hypothetical protein